MSNDESFASIKEKEVFRHFRLGEHLLQRNMISLPQLKEAMEEQQNTGKLIGEILLTKGFITVETLQEGLEYQHNADNLVNNLKSEIKDKITFKIVEE